MKAARVILAIIFAVSLVGVLYSGPKSWNDAWNVPARQGAAWFLLLAISLAFLSSSFTIFAFTFSKAETRDGQLTIRNDDFLVKFLKKSEFIEPHDTSLNICKVFWATVLITTLVPIVLVFAIAVMGLYIKALITDPIITLYVTTLLGAFIAAFVYAIVLGKWPRLELWVEKHPWRFLGYLGGLVLTAWLIGSIIYKGSFVDGLTTVLIYLAIVLGLGAFIAAVAGLLIGVAWLVEKLVKKIQARWPAKSKKYREPRPTPAVVTIIVSGIEGFKNNTCSEIRIV